MIDFPCTQCEHLGSEHYTLPIQLRWCETCFYTHGKDMGWQHVFKADNLKYLENRLNEIPE